MPAEAETIRGGERKLEAIKSTEEEERELDKVDPFEESKL